MMSQLLSQKTAILLLLPSTLLTLYIFYNCINLRQTISQIPALTQDHLKTEATSANTLENSKIACIGFKSNETLPDISDFPPDVRKRNIFFLETSCRSHDMGKLFLNARQACAVESAANMNPGNQVYLLFASPGVLKDENTESDRIIKALQKYSNIKLMYFDTNRYVQGSPVEPLWTSGRLKTSIYPLAHTSDVLRYLTLWKYGGIYLDLDVTVIKNLDILPINFAGAESADLIATGVMGFDSTGIGHRYITECLEDVNAHFDGDQWAFNGPLLITRNILAHCPNTEARDLIASGRCEDFYIMSTKSFYPIHWSEWYKYFNSSWLGSIESEIQANSYLIHVWNKMSFETLIAKNDTEVPYLRVARRYCPEVVKQLDEFF